MNLDPARSEAIWRGLLQSEAEAAWGAERAAELEPGLERTGRALWRITQRRPRRESIPYRAPAPAPVRNPGGEHV